MKTLIPGLKKGSSISIGAAANNTERIGRNRTVNMLGDPNDVGAAAISDGS